MFPRFIITSRSSWVVDQWPVVEEQGGREWLSGVSVYNKNKIVFVPDSLSFSLLGLYIPYTFTVIIMIINYNYYVHLSSVEFWHVRLLTLPLLFPDIHRDILFYLCADFIHNGAFTILETVHCSVITLLFLFSIPNKS